MCRKARLLGLSVLMMMGATAAYTDRMLGSTELDPVSAARVEMYVERYTAGEVRARITDMIASARLFYPFIRDQVVRRGLPAELAFLPTIESGYNPAATSPSGAVGIWQFMPNTMPEYDLRADEYSDERRDFWKSTESALKKLEHDYNELGDWFLALAAYNCGLNRVKEAIEESGERAYWKVAELLPPETAEYVPKFLAILEIVGNFEMYGFEDWTGYGWRWTRLHITTPVQLRMLAERAGVPIEILRAGNADLRFDVTPPVDSYSLKVPDIHADTINRAIQSGEIEMTDYLVHRIKPGDTLSAIAGRYGIAIETIINFNPGIRPRFLQINSPVIIPERTPRDAPETIHVVKRGDTLTSIARLYNTSVAVLKNRNTIRDPDHIMPGLRLAVPQAGNPW